MKKDIIKETLSFKELTDEEKQARGILGRLYGPCADFINPTRNGRTYSDELWEKVFNENELVKEAFANGGIFGELDHPLDREEIDSSKIAICMPEPPKKDKDGHLIAYFDILDTPNGRIAYALAKYGYKLGISSRGTGDIDEMNDSVIPDTYDFKCFDLVLTPSVKDARLTMTESLDNKQINFKKALQESLNKADPNDKKIMEDTLNNLNINLTEAEEVKEEPAPVENEEEIKLDLEEPVAEEIPAEEEKSFEDKIKELFALTYKEDKAPTDEETEAFVQAFISIFPEECFNQEGCADKKEEEESEVKQTEDEPEEAADDGEDELIQSLQDALNAKMEAESQVKSLQEQLAVSDTKVSKLNEEINQYKDSTMRLSLLARESKKLQSKVNSLEEALNQKDSEIKSLTEEKSKVKLMTESLSNKDNTIDRISKEAVKKDTEIKKLKESLESTNSKVTEKEKLVERYKKFANEVTSRYLESKATMLGIPLDGIKSRLPAKYNLKDIDRICEDLQQEYSNRNNLPFNLNDSKIRKVQLVESKKDNLKLPSYVDDEVDDSLLELAKLK